MARYLEAVSELNPRVLNPYMGEKRDAYKILFGKSEETTRKT
jgi:hypothetical protein